MVEARNNYLVSLDGHWTVDGVTTVLLRRKHRGKIIELITYLFCEDSGIEKAYVK